MATKTTATFILLMYFTAVIFSKEICCDKEEGTSYSVNEDDSFIYTIEPFHQNLRALTQQASAEISRLPLASYGTISIRFSEETGSLNGLALSHYECCNETVMQYKEWQDAKYSLDLGSFDVTYNIVSLPKLPDWFEVAAGAKAKISSTPSQIAPLYYKQFCSPNVPSEIGYAAGGNSSSVGIEASIGGYISASAGFRFRDVALGYVSAQAAAWLSLVTSANFIVSPDIYKGDPPTIEYNGLGQKTLMLLWEVQIEAYVVGLGTWNILDVGGHADLLEIP